MHKELDHWGGGTRWLRLAEASIEDIFQSSYLTPCQVLRVQVDFNTVNELQNILAVLGEFLLSSKPGLCLLQVKYKQNTLNAEARELHQVFMDQHAQVSSYLPLCLPPSPLGEQVIWASPNNCKQCIFLEAQRCGGLNGDESIDNPLFKDKAEAGGALRSHWSIPLQIDEFKQSPPVCYWWPESRLIPILGAIFNKKNCQTMWDIGGANGFVAWWLKHSFTRFKHVFCIDPVSEIYASKNGVNYLSIDAEKASKQVEKGHLLTPGLMVISWPSPGLLFAKVIQRLQPKVLIRVTDSQGVCGVRRGHRALTLSSHRAEVYGLSEAFDERGAELDELDPPHGYKLVYCDTLWCYRDFQTQASEPSALFRVYESL